MDKNLFGDDIEFTPSEIEKMLREFDDASFAGRFERAKYVNEIYPEGFGFMASLEVFYLMMEAKTTFINGQFASTILVSQACIEHWLNSQLHESHNLRLRAGIQETLNCLCANNLLHPFLIEKIERLRQIRNPFVHVRPNDANRLDQHAVIGMKSPNEILEDDARSALSIMYQVVISRL